MAKMKDDLPPFADLRDRDYDDRPIISAVDALIVLLGAVAIATAGIVAFEWLVGRIVL